MKDRLPLVIGLVGLPCAGKSEAAAALRRLGVQTIEADKVGHEIIRQPVVRRAIMSRFGKDACGKNGQVDRRALAAIVFKNAKSRRYLERIMHPRIICQIRKRLRVSRRPAAIAAAILFRLGLHRLCDRIWLVKASAENRRRRARWRGWSASEMERRSRIVRDDIKPHRHLIDEVIANDGDLCRLRRSVRKIWKEEFYAATSRKKA